jgi:hypothetical protein
MNTVPLEEYRKAMKLLLRLTSAYLTDVQFESVVCQFQAHRERGTMPRRRRKARAL